MIYVEVYMTRAYGLKAILKALIVSYIVTGILLFGIAFSMYKLGLKEQTINLMVTFVYLFATGVGGILIGKNMKHRKFLWGFLLGFIYVVIIFAASFIATGGMTAILSNGLGTLLLCAGGGMLGGMLS
ncbi:MAG: TIGR04086 family membrane protein [Lachnospiraceae bacterium]|nr:TIGR04086 family membrane protein [Lachnospiraceae bacterium]